MQLQRMAAVVERNRAQLDTAPAQLPQLPLSAAAQLEEQVAAQTSSLASLVEATKALRNRLGDVWCELDPAARDALAALPAPPAPAPPAESAQDGHASATGGVEQAVEETDGSQPPDQELLLFESKRLLQRREAAEAAQLRSPGSVQQRGSTRKSAMTPGNSGSHGKQLGSIRKPALVRSRSAFTAPE